MEDHHPYLLVLPQALTEEPPLVQNRLGYYWTEERVNRRADRAMKLAFDNIYAASEKYNINMRLAAYVVALDKVSTTLKLRGSF